MSGVIVKRLKGSKRGERSRETDGYVAGGGANCPNAAGSHEGAWREGEVGALAGLLRWKMTEVRSAGEAWPCR